MNREIKNNVNFDLSDIENDKEYLECVAELLNNKVDSLLIEIGKVDSIIVEINNTYEKDSNNIINQHISEDIMFFSNYLSKNSF